MNAVRIRPKWEARPAANLKLWATLGFLSLVLIVSGHVLGDRYGLLIGFFLALGLNALVIFFTDVRLGRIFRSYEIEGRDAWGVLRMTSRISHHAGLTPPKVHVIHAVFKNQKSVNSTPTAYSAGILPNRAHLFLSDELLKKFSAEEIQAIIAIEVARIKFFQTSSGTVAAALAGLLTSLSNLLDNTIFLQAFRTEKPGQIRPARLIFMPFIALLVRMAVHKKHILEADRFAAGWLRSPELIARAIAKLDSFQKSLPLDIRLSEAHLFTVNPLARFAWCRPLRPAPTAAERIAALTGHFQL